MSCLWNCRVFAVEVWMSDQEGTLDEERVRQCPFCKEEIKVGCH
jgi:hypothetical protein